MQRRLAQIEESVARYLSQLDTTDRQIAAGEAPSEALAARTTRLKEKLAKLEAEVVRLRAIEKKMLARPDQQISFTDSRFPLDGDQRAGLRHGRLQRAGRRRYDEPSDRRARGHERRHRLGAVANVAGQAKEALHTDKLQAVADRGYFKGEEILACEEAGITVTLPKPQTSGAKSKGRFGKQDFVYLPSEDAYHCPAGEKLKYYFTAEESGQQMRRYWTNACRTCPIKAQCTTAEQRRITRWSTSMSSRPCRQGLDKNPGRDACAPLDGRASVRHAEDADGRDALSDEDACRASPPRWR